jgi:protein phosphatase PTC7
MVWMVSSSRQQEVSILSAQRAYSTASSAMWQSGSALKLEAYGACIPHPEKVEKGGEDAFFVSSDGGAVGVFDGVGGWSEMGIDPGIYSKSLAMESNAAYEQLGAQSPVNVLEKAWLNSQHLQGSSTACCVTIEVRKRKRKKKKNSNLYSRAICCVEPIWGIRDFWWFGKGR